MEDGMIISSKMCGVHVIGEARNVMEADLSVLCRDGKFGLVHTSMLCEGEGLCLYDGELILPCEYDNIFFTETEFEQYLVAVSKGKQGLFCFEGCSSGILKQVEAVQLVPCIYDRIETCRENDMIFLYSGKRISCFHRYRSRIFTECETARELCCDWLLCISGERIELWNTHLPKLVCTLDTCRISYLGTYERGDVFRLNYWDESEGLVLHQLLFCEYQGDGCHFGPKARSLTVWEKTERKERRIVGIEMSFGNKEEKLSTQTVNEITRDIHSFEELIKEV